MGKDEKTILVTNDDGVHARGLQMLIEAVKPLGRLVVVAPENAQSGMSQAITVKTPLRLYKLHTAEGIDIYSVNGTPADCVKLAMSQLIDGRTPDFLVSGINHGSNAATSVLYSGTMGAALEGCVNHVPSIGFSHVSYDPNADFEAAKKYARSIAACVLENGLPKNICLNVNFPNVPGSQVKGVKVCRQNMGHWIEEFDKRTDPVGREYYWLTGSFHNSEPDADDTDEWALKNNYVSVVPMQTDLTCYQTRKIMEQWDFE